ncbi:MAG: hypothetical protein ACM30D_03815 [Hyphomicrobiales bacterium]
MPSVAYFRRQADICFRLALIASDERALAKQAGADASSTVDPGALPDIAGDDPVTNLPPHVPDSSADC